MRKKAKAALQQAYLLYVVLAVACLLTLSYVVVRQENARHATEVRELVARDAQAMAHMIEEKLFSMELIANRLAIAASISGEVSEKLLDSAAATLAEHHSDIISVAIAPDLKVTHVAPREGNEKVLGLDYRQTPVQLASVAHAYRSHAPVLSGPINLVQGGRGYVMRYPVFEASPKTGVEHFWGVISIVFREDGLFAISRHEANFKAPVLVALRATTADGKWGLKTFGDEEVFDRDPIIRNASMFDTNWKIALAPAAGWPRTSPAMWPLILVMTIVSCLIGGASFWIRNLTRQTEQAHRLLANAVEALDEGFVLYDRKDRLVVCNSKFSNFYASSIGEPRPGLRYETLIRLAAKLRQPGAMPYDEDAWVRSRLEGHKLGQEFLYRQEAGRWLKISEARTADGFCVSVCSDITEQKQAQSIAEEADRQKTEFLSNVTHELRTPLTVINGYAQILQHAMFVPHRARLQEALESRKIDPEEIRKAAKDYDAAIAGYSEKIGTSSTHMLNMVNDLLDWAEVERNAITLEPRDLLVSDIFADIVEDLRSEAEAKGLELLTTFEETQVHADPKRIKQVLYNLIGNAIKFTEQGHIRVGAQVVDGMVHFSVQDTGCGIAAEDLDRVFERFQQADGSNTRAHGGFGLGLAIARQIVESHGGRITAVSKLGRGSRFTCELPCSANASTADEEGQAVAA